MKLLSALLLLLSFSSGAFAADRAECKTDKDHSKANKEHAEYRKDERKREQARLKDEHKFQHERAKSDEQFRREQAQRERELAREAEEHARERLDANRYQGDEGMIDRDRDADGYDDDYYLDEDDDREDHPIRRYEKDER